MSKYNPKKKEKRVRHHNSPVCARRQAVLWMQEIEEDKPNILIHVSEEANIVKMYITSKDL